MKDYQKINWDKYSIRVCILKYKIWIVEDI